MTKKNLTRGIALLLAVVMLLAFAGCEKTPANTDPTNGTTPTGGTNPTNPEAPKTYTYHTYTTLSPSNWNELTYQDSNDTQIMSYIGSSFFSYDFKYDEYGEILPGEFVMKYEAATALEDVTAAYAEAWGLPADGKGFAYKITLREDLKWDDGTPIKAEDFVYTMQEQLNPLFHNYRADSFYVGSTVIANAAGYAKQGQTVMEDNSATGLYASVADLTKGADGVYTQPDGKVVYFALNTPLAWCGGKTVTQYSPYMDADAFAALKALADDNGYVAVTDDTIALVTKLIYTENWGYEPPENVPFYMVYEYSYPAVDFSEVGIFVGETEYEIILVLDKSLPLLKDDGSLSYQAAYNMSSLPLVKKDLYESCKQEPAEGTTDWTTNYNSSVATTASWGPYKLESFQSGTQYVLVKIE